jgi:hypothetical protein
MQHYLMSVVYPWPASEMAPDAPPPPDVDLEQIEKDVDAVHQEIQAAGGWVFGGGLHHPSTATVVQVKEGEAITTDGPFAEGKEHLGGLSIVKAPDLDTALDWGRKMARATTLPIEVRPFQGTSED